MTAHSESDFASAAEWSRPNEPTSARRGKRGAVQLEARKENIKPSDLSAAKETVKKKAAMLQILSGDAYEVAVIIRKKTDGSSSYEIVGGLSDGDAESLVRKAAKIIAMDSTGKDKGEEYRTKKNVTKFEVTCAGKAIEQSKAASSQKKTKANRPALSEISKDNTPGVCAL